MKKLALFLFICRAALAFNAQGLAVTKTSLASGSHPNAAPFTAITSFSVVARVHNCTTGGTVYWDNDIQINTTCTGVTFTSWRDSFGGSGQESIGLPPGTTDFTLRASRNNANKTLAIEVWQTNTGSALNHSDIVPPANWCAAACSGGVITDMPGPFGIGNGSLGCACTVDYVRLFSTAPVVSPGNIPSPNPGGDLGDWELDGVTVGTCDSSNKNDSSGNSQTLLLAGSPVATCQNTPTYAPIVAFPAANNCFLSSTYAQKFCTVPAGQPAPLRTTAYSPNLNDTITYAWSQTGGPTGATITNGTTANATANGLTAFGEYDFQIAVTDLEANTTATTLRLGSVTLNPANSCLVTDVPASMAAIVGPLTPWGSTCDPWPWYDIAEVGSGLNLQAQYSFPASFNQISPGTITVAANTTSITGTGTHFLTDCGGGSCAGWALLIMWNAPMATSPVLSNLFPTGRSIQTINTVTDNTHMSLNAGNFKYLPPIAQSANVHYILLGNWDATIATTLAVGFGWRDQPSYSWNYYDNVVGLYRLYYRTGITAFLTHARELADAWYTVTIDQGYSSVSTPRDTALPGLMLRALDGQPNYWVGIELKLDLAGPRFGFPAHTVAPGLFDPRDQGYQASYYSLDVQIDPILTAPKKTEYCTDINNAIEFLFGPQQLASGGYYIDDYGLNENAPSFSPGANGNEPWLLGVTATGIKDSYIALKGVCGNPSRAGQAFSMLGNLLNYIYTYGGIGIRPIPPANGGGNGIKGMAFMIDYEASGESDWKDGVGTVSGTGTTITGTGTSFAANYAGGGYAPCDGSTMIGIKSIAKIFRVVGCPTNTTMSLEASLPSTITNSGYQIIFRDASTSCSPSRGMWCFGPQSPDDAVVLPGIYQWYYLQTGNMQYKVWGDDWFAAAYGGPATGPGTTGLPAGPGSAGDGSNEFLVDEFGYIGGLPLCSVSSPPCIHTLPGQYGKGFGTGSGYVGSSSNALAYRLSITPSQCQPQ
jgi:hypothetical protein